MKPEADLQQQEFMDLSTLADSPRPLKRHRADRPATAELPSRISAVDLTSAGSQGEWMPVQVWALSPSALPCLAGLVFAWVCRVLGVRRPLPAAPGLLQPCHRDGLPLHLRHVGQGAGVLEVQRLILWGAALRPAPGRAKAHTCLGELLAAVGCPPSASATPARKPLARLLRWKHGAAGRGSHRPGPGPPWCALLYGVGDDVRVGPRLCTLLAPFADDVIVTRVTAAPAQPANAQRHVSRGRQGSRRAGRAHPALPPTRVCSLVLYSTKLSVVLHLCGRASTRSHGTAGAHCNVAPPSATTTCTLTDEALLAPCLLAGLPRPQPACATVAGSRRAGR